MKRFHSIDALLELLRKNNYLKKKIEKQQQKSLHQATIHCKHEINCICDFKDNKMNLKRRGKRRTVGPLPTRL